MTRPEVALLVARLSANWTVDSALRAFADDLHDPTADMVVMDLLSGAHRRGDAWIETMATVVADDVHNRRAGEADRAWPRATTARWVTMLVVAVLGFMMFLHPGYVSTYKSGLGQLLLSLLLLLFGTYAARLAWMQRAPRGTTSPQFLTSGTARPGRSELTRDLTVFFDLVALELDQNGTGTTQSLKTTAECGNSWMFQRLKEELRLSELRHVQPWDGLWDLSVEIGITELADLSDTMRLTGGGGATETSLRAKADCIRDAMLSADLAPSQRRRGLSSLRDWSSSVLATRWREPRR